MNDDMDGFDIEIITDDHPLGNEGSILRARGVILNGQEVVVLDGAEFSLHTKLGRSGFMQATFTVMVKSINFRGRDAWPG